MPLSIVIPAYPGVTHLDFTGPHQFFSRLPGANVIVASLGGEAVTADGLTFANLTPLEAVEACDVLCVPGGAGCAPMLEHDAFLSQIVRTANQARYITSVCTGSLILGAAGLLAGKHAACHWAWRDLLAAFGAIPDAGRVVRDGNIITGGGVTAGIDFALTVIEEVAGIDAAQSIQFGLEYAPQPPHNAGTPDTAPAAIVRAYKEQVGPLMPARQAAVERAAAKLRAGGAARFRNGA